MNQKELDRFYERLTLSKKVKPIAKAPSTPAIEILKFSDLEPSSFDEYIGQEKAKEFVQILVTAAKKDNRRIPNILFSGPAGLGKTTLAKLVLKGMPAMFVDGNAVNSTYSDLFGHVIIDEIHNVKPNVCDSLNILVDNNKLNILGCTTNAGQIPKALRSRFRTVSLFPYTDEDLVAIMKGVLARKKKSKTIKDDFLLEIAKRSRNTPRRAIQYLLFTLDLISVKGQNKLSDKLLEESFRMIGVDERGLLEIDHKYLAAFPNDWNRSVGIQYLSAVLGIDRETLEEDVEPYLMQLKLIDRTAKGRKLINT